MFYAKMGPPGAEITHLAFIADHLIGGLWVVGGQI